MALWSKEHPVYGTGDEMAFLRRIHLHARGSGKTRLQLLEGYLAGAELRTDWGKIEGTEVKALCLELIRQEKDHCILTMPGKGGAR